MLMGKYDVLQALDLWVDALDLQTPAPTLKNDLINDFRFDGWDSNAWPHPHSSSRVMFLCVVGCDLVVYWFSRLWMLLERFCSRSVTCPLQSA